MLGKPISSMSSDEFRWALFKYLGRKSPKILWALRDEFDRFDSVKDATEYLKFIGEFESDGIGRDVLLRVLEGEQGPAYG